MTSSLNELNIYAFVNFFDYSCIQTHDQNLKQIKTLDTPNLTETHKSLLHQNVCFSRFYINMIPKPQGHHYCLQ